MLYDFGHSIRSAYWEDEKNEMNIYRTGINTVNERMPIAESTILTKQKMFLSPCKIAPHLVRQWYVIRYSIYW